MSLLIVVTLLQRYRTGDRRYAREYCCSFEKSCLFFLKDSVLGLSSENKSFGARGRSPEE